MSSPTLLTPVHPHSATSPGPPRGSIPGAGGKRGSDEGGGRGRGGGGGVMNTASATAEDTIRNSSSSNSSSGGSVYSSSSYAASRGLQRGQATPKYSPDKLEQQPVPVAPPRAKGVTIPPTLGVASTGIMRSSSEIFISASSGTPPSKGILKSSSGVMKSQSAVATPISRSSSGSVLTSANRVNFSCVVSNLEDAPSTPPSEPQAGTSPAVAVSSSPTLTSRIAVSLVAPGSKVLGPGVSSIPSSPPFPSSPPSSSSSLPTGSSSRALSSSSSPSSTPPPVAPPRLRSMQTPTRGERGSGGSSGKRDQARGPTGRTLTRQPEDTAPLQQQSAPPQPARRKAAEPQQQSKSTQHSVQQKGVKISDYEQQQITSRKKQESQKPRQSQQHQTYQYREEEKHQQTKRQQQQFHKTPGIDIPEWGQRHWCEEEQHFQQLIRAGSLGSGEPAAILEQRRSRSPLPSPIRTQPISSSPKEIQLIGASPRERQATGGPFLEKQAVVHPGGAPASVFPSSKPGDVTREGSSAGEPTRPPQNFANAEKRRSSGDKICAFTPVWSGEAAEGSGTRATAAPVQQPPSGTVPAVAAVETRTDVIRAAAKAYSESFQSYSYSSYLTRTRKDSVTSKEAPLGQKEQTENPAEVKLPSVSSDLSGTPTSPSTAGSSSHNTTAKPFTRGPVGKATVSLSSFSGKSKESTEHEGNTSSCDSATDAAATSPSTPAAVIAAAATAGVTAATKSVTPKTDQNKGQSNSISKEVAAASSSTTKAQKQQVKEANKGSRDKGSATSSNTRNISSGGQPTEVINKRLPKSLPPLLSGVKVFGSEKMKGNSEGALLVACRVAEEDQVLKLLKELTATGTLDAQSINQADRSGRTSLSYSCANAFLRVVENLTVVSGLDINKPDTDGNTPLHYASQAGHTEVVSHLVNKCSRSVDLDARNALGFTPLMKAALQGRTKCAKILLFAGASPHLRDFGRGLCAVEWARYTGRHICSELIESVQKSCSSHIRDRWSSDPDLKSHSSSSINTLGQHDNKESWIKHKIKKAFHKSESKKEFSVVTNLSTMAVCATSPVLPTAVASHEMKPHQMVVPHVQVTEVKVPDCYEDPEDVLSRLPPPPPPAFVDSPEEPTTQDKSPKKPTSKSNSSTSPSSSSSSSATTSSSSTTSSTSSSSSSSTPPPASTSSSSPASTKSTSSGSSNTGAATAATSRQEVKTGAETKSNGAAKSIVSSSKLPFSGGKKRK